MRLKLATIWTFLMLAVALHGVAQLPDTISLRIDGSKVFVTVNLQLPTDVVDSLLKPFGSDVNCVQLSPGDVLEGEGQWKIVDVEPDFIRISKSLDELKGKLNTNQKHLLAKYKDGGFYSARMHATYGVNRFRYRAVRENRAGESVFWLPGMESATKVYLSGTFNDWSTKALPMQRTDSGWVVKVKLPPGKYWYKYIVDGRWRTDPGNRNKEPDGDHNENSIYFRSNHEFRLAGQQQARKVIVCGGFNGWNERELQLQKDGNGWSLPIYLIEGVHPYKFIVDRQWMVDPKNPVVRGDGDGNDNSILTLGDPHYFELAGFQDAEQVVLTGSFNGWNESELKMQKTATGWKLPYVVPEGTHQYKFIVDGRWITDPQNPQQTGEGDYLNSVLTIGANHVFRLKGHENAREVKVAGSFNGWDSEGLSMVKKEGVWVLPVHLKPGKHLYKFIVDGQWIHDPDNDLWERNEFDGKNSVLWL